MNNTQTTPESMNDFDMEMDFESQLENYLNSDFGDIEEGVIVSGEVVKIDETYILVDVNFKSEGQIPLDEFMENGRVAVKVGDTVDVYVVRKNEREGSIVLSREKAKRMQVLDELEKLLESGDVVVGRIVRRIKGG